MARPRRPPARDADCPLTWIVGEDEYFVMGDNRPSSQDSRVFGPVDETLILGRAWLRYFPLERIGLIERPSYPALVAADAAAASGSGRLLRHDPGVDLADVVDQARRPRTRGASSVSAVSGASEAWIRLRRPLTPRSPRIVPGSASFGIVLPTILRTTAIASGPSSATAATGPEVMNSTSPS